jgi:hypothetical protein
MSAPTADRQASITGWLGRHPLPAFTVLAYALSWAGWLPLLADRQDWVG